jgi:hypothetical protein
MLSAKPRKSKYTVEDTVYFNDNGTLKEFVINKVVVKVSNPLGTTNGYQVNTYGITGKSGYIEEKYLFTTKKELLANIKGGYITYPDQWAYIQALWDDDENDFTGADFNGLHVTDVRWTNAIIDGSSFQGIINLRGDFDTTTEMKAGVESYDRKSTIWKDGHPIVDCRGITFTGNISTLDLTGRWFDEAVFTGCTMPTNADTKSEFKALVGSWDAVTTIWTDGLPIGS